MADRTVSVRLKAEVAGYVSGINKAADATRSLADDAKRHIGSVSRSLAGMSRGAQLVGAVGAIAIGRQFVNAASDLNETMNKTNVVFGHASASVTAWSKDSAKAMGMSQQQALESAATFGNLFAAMKIGQGPAAQMSQRLVALAGDLASFNNADPTETLQAIRSGLVGEVEPLRKFGVNLSEVTLRQKALEMGLVSTTTNTLPPAIRTQAAYALILEQTTTAQGDFTRTADGLANSQRTLTAEWQNTQAQLGQALLPTVNAVVKALNTGLGVVNALPEPVRLVAVAVGVAGAAFLLLAPRAVDAWDALKRIEEASPRTAAGIKGVGKAVAVLTGVLAVASIANNTLSSSTISVDDALAKLAANHATDQLGTAIANFVGATTTLNDAGAAIDGVDQKLADLVSNGYATLAAQQYDDMRKKFLAAGGDLAIFDAHTKAYKAAVDQAKNATDPFAKSIDGVGESASGASTEVKSLKDQIDGLRGTQMSADEATANLESAIDRATASVKENGKAFSVTTEKGRANQAALRDLATAALDGVDAWVQNGASAKAVAGKTQEARDAFVRTAIQMGATKAQAEKLATAYGLVPKTVATTVTASAGPALAAADAVRRRWQSTVAYIAAHPAKYGAYLTAAKGGPVPAFAGGGAVSGPGSSTSDSIDARLSAGEYVVNAQAASRHRPLLDAMNYGGQRITSSSPRAGGGGAESFTVTTPVQLLLDSVAVWQGQLRLKRSRGGIELGLA